MKTIFTIIFSLSISFTYCQDIIIKTDGNEIEAKVLEISDDVIKYKAHDFLDGPTRSINITDVMMIIYANGHREKFTTPGTAKPIEEPTVVNDTKIEEQSVNTIDEKPGGYFSIAGGYGNSYGGLGARLQYVTRGNTRLGFHGGVGYLPSTFGGSHLFSGGIQIFFGESYYVDLQYGSFGVYELSYYDSFFGTTYYSGVLAGPSLLFGYDWFLGDNIAINLGTGLSIDTNYDPGASSWALDVGLVFKL